LGKNRYPSTLTGSEKQHQAGENPPIMRLPCNAGAVGADRDRSDAHTAEDKPAA